MNQPVNDPSNSSPKLSNADERRLKAYLRDADAIIAAEWGLNSTSRVKLESLAKNQQLPARLFDIALTQLQVPASIENTLSRYEQAFANFLDSEFRKLRGGVLSIRAEQKAFELATNKYQISVLRADQIIGARAKLAAIERIAHSDAADYAERFVREQIKDRLTVDDSFRDSIQERGEKLGLATAQIEALVLRLLNENRQQKHLLRRRRLIRCAVAGLLLCGGAAGAYSWSRLWPAETLQSQLALPEPILQPSAEGPIDVASWLSSETLELIEQVERELTDQPELKSQLLDEHSQVRAVGYRELSQAAVQHSFSDPQLVKSLLGNLFFEELETDSITALIEPLLECMQLATDGPSIPIERFEQQLNANQILAEIYNRALENPIGEAQAAIRKQSLAEQVQPITGVSPQGLALADYLERSEQSIATEQWNYLIQNSWSKPALVTALLPPLIHLTRSRLPLELRSRLQSRLLKSLLDVEPDQWINLQPILTETLVAADEFELIEWVQLVLHSDHENFQRFAGQLLLNQFDISLTSSRQSDLVAALERYAENYRNQQLQPLLDRNDLAINTTKQFLETLAGSEQPVDPDHVAQLATLVNVQLAVCQQLQNSDLMDHRGLLLIDALLEKPKIRLREIVALSGTSGAPSPTPIPTASDINRKNLALQRITNLANEQRSSRIRAIDDLEAIASRFGDLSYAEASILAGYFLNPPTVEEELNIQRRISSFSHWTNLGLALGDYLTQNKLAIDKALTMMRLFFRREFDVTKADDNWIGSIQNQILESTMADLTSRIGNDPSNTRSDWVRLESYLSELYYQRGQYLAESNGPLISPPTSEPADVLLTWIEFWLDNWNGPISESNRFARAKVFIRQGDYDGMQQTVMANRLLFDLLQDETLPASTVEDVELSVLVQRIKEKCHTQILGDQLLLVELDLLEEVSRRRESFISYRLRRRE